MLDKAKKVKGGNKITMISKEEIDLALAWANGEISLKQAAAAYGMGPSSVIYGKLALALRAHLQKKN